MTRRCPNPEVTRRVCWSQQPQSFSGGWQGARTARRAGRTTNMQAHRADRGTKFVTLRKKYYFFQTWHLAQLGGSIVKIGHR